jgi:hypothetical protein
MKVHARPFRFWMLVAVIALLTVGHLGLIGFLPHGTLSAGMVSGVILVMVVLKHLGLIGAGISYLQRWWHRK